MEQIRVNGRTLPHVTGELPTLLTNLGYSSDQQGIAVALNGRVIPRGQWADQTIADGDEIDIVGAVQGG